MREYNDEDLNKPRPVHPRRKGSNWFERAEAAPVRPLRGDTDLDRHRHVV